MSAQELDTTKLAHYLADHIPEFSGELKAEKFAGGQSNPTFKVTAGENQYVLRRKPP
ncbi:MAG: aminoglycoside phosphotransferase (APT) family kinase protein, partial [Halieaceae bacterium]